MFRMDWTTVTLGLLAGLTIFLFGMARLSDDLKLLAAERMQAVLARFTTNPLAGMLTGVFATFVLDSSSLTIVLVIALVHAGALSFQGSLGVVLGSNIGTSISSQIFALEVDRFAPALLIAGFLAMIAGRGRHWGRCGSAVFSVGLVFYGLHEMGAAMKPLGASPGFLSWIRGLENLGQGVMAGAAGTAVIQSSSAMMGAVIKLASAGVITFPVGVAVMLGAEIGTCLDTLLASMGRTRQALRTGVFHLMFNVITVLFGLLLYEYLSGWALQLPSGGSASRQIANAHLLFNVAGAMLFLPLVPLSARILTAAIPERSGDAREMGTKPEG